MTFFSIYPAIALATVVNGFALALAIKADRIEASTGSSPAWFVFGSIAYIGAIGGFHYLTKNQPITTYFETMMAAIGAEAMGGIFFWTMFRAFFPKPGTPKGERFMSFVGVVLFGFIMVGPMLV